ncbi:MAG: DNA internalization-related competence protein ComEC/Rec2 [Pseudolabrys sp.]|jgi:competence protein ComEC|nr:DNA internalization-related competence protein ComEC/Rec2 [Pseudolabrys sp.]
MTPGDGNSENFAARARARARALADTFDSTRRRAGLMLPEGVEAGFQALREQLSRWLVAEFAPGRLLPWVPVAFGLGVVFYFTADHEPSLWAAGSLLIGCLAVAFATRRRPAAFPIAIGCAALAAGFAAGTLKTRSIAHPVLAFPATVSVSGFVEVREERDRGDRIVIRVDKLAGSRLRVAPDRVRVAVRKGTAPAVGDYVVLKAHLSPPLEPLRPGGYDFARDMYFQGIGASGYALGAIKVTPPAAAPGWRLQFMTMVDGIRETIDDHIRTELDGDRGSIASALITGKRDAITVPVNDAMYISSLGHVLSISGYHMAVVAGIAFFILRAILALIPSLAINYPIKKWSAAAALLAATLYLILSGAEVATQRSYIMIAIVLVGVMFDRAALTFRTLTVAALAVMLLAPQAVVHPSFQMSFAATLALVAAYRYGLNWRPGADSSAATRFALWGARELVALVLASLVAGLATTPYVAYHFHRISPYGVLANLLAMPVVSAWVMPMGLLGLVAYPFGFDDYFWHLMGYGIDWMIVVASWVAGLPGAVGRVAAFGTGPLLLATAGLLLVCLLRTRLRWSGALVMGLAALWTFGAVQPDIFITRDGEAVAVRGQGGRLTVVHGGRDAFTVREWLAADADPRTPRDKTLETDVRCDDEGCIGRLSDGRLVALSLAPEAFAEDCARAAVVVSPHDAPGDCQALLVDRKVWRAHGAIALSIRGDTFAVTEARPSGVDRPWSPGHLGTAASGQTRPAAVRSAAPPAGSLLPDDQ